MSRSTYFDKEAQDALIKGLDLVADAVKSTLGPAGMTVVIQKPDKDFIVEIIYRFCKMAGDALLKEENSKQLNTCYIFLNVHYKSICNFHISNKLLALFETFSFGEFLSEQPNDSFNIQALQ